MNQELLTVLASLADDLHTGARDVSSITPLFGAHGLIRLGLPVTVGGHGDLWQAVEAVAEAAEVSLTGAFALWGQRAVAELVAHGASDWLQANVLPDILEGRLAAASGLSNAMKSLSGIEGFQLEAARREGETIICGRLPWVSNLQPGGFVVSAVAQPPAGAPVVFLAPSGATGVVRGDDFQLMGLQGSATAAVHFDEVCLNERWMLQADARSLLTKIRPAFLLLQCGLPLGLARRALAQSRTALSAGHLLEERLDALQNRWEALKSQCWQLCSREGRQHAVPELFQLRIHLTQLTIDTVFMELQAMGGKAYAAGSLVSRHVSEAAFLPLLTPTVAHLERELQKYNAARRCA